MKFTINGRVTVSCFTTVEADTEEEAREIATERELAGLCHMPFDADHDEAWHIETDGTPQLDGADGVTATDCWTSCPEVPGATCPGPNSCARGCIRVRNAGVTDIEGRQSNA